MLERGIAVAVITKNRVESFLYVQITFYLLFFQMVLHRVENKVRMRGQKNITSRYINVAAFAPNTYGLCDLLPLL